jgi:capsular exopolysaccharide synthesis family protein
MRQASRCLLITSSRAREGKTATAVNIATALAQTNERVLVIDCDLRNPRVHRALGTQPAPGLSEYLSGAGDELAPLVQESRVRNLFCLSAGSIPANPAELIGSLQMKEALACLSNRFDHIIVDSPPVLTVTDARILATIVDGVVLVIRAGETPRGAVLQAKRLLESVQAPLLGVILYDADVFSGDYYHYARYCA